MPNLPLNQTYGTTGDQFKIGSTIKLSPMVTSGNTPAPAGNLGARLQASPNTPALPWRSLNQTLAAKENALQQYTYGAGVPTETPAFPSVDTNGAPIPVVSTPIPVPSDYSGFVPSGGFTNAKEGTQLSWTTPTSPVIKNYPGDVQGQYVEDTVAPDALIKSVRGSNPSENKFILNGRSSDLYQIDHIMPLELGGADTMANREVLTFSQNEQKTKAQAVPYTLYAHGVISLSEARLMASSWQNRDVGGLANPDNVGMIPLSQAQDAAARWTQPVKPTFKDVMAGIPQAAQDFGKGWLPDPIREFVKGVGSGATFGFLPDTLDTNATALDKIASFGGNLVGGIGSFILGGAILDGVVGATATGLRVLGSLRGTAATAAAAEGLVSSAPVATEAAPGLGARILNAFRKPVATEVAQAVPDTAPDYIFKGFVSPLTKPTVKGALKFAGTNVLVGQMQALVQNQLNPEILSGKKQATAEQYWIPKILSDAVIGGVAGVASPTLKGASLAMAPVLALNYIEDPYHPLNALTSSAVFGAFHLAGSAAKKADITNLKQSFAETGKSQDFQMFKSTVLDRPHYNTLSYYAPELFPEIKPGGAIPASAYEPAVVTAAANKAIAALDIRREFDLNPDGTPARAGMSDQAYLAEKARITTAANQMAIGGLSPELQEQANIANIISFAKSLKGKKGPNGENLGSRFDQLQEIGVPKVTADIGKYIADNKANFTSGRTTPVTTGTFLNGDIAGTGPGIIKNTEIAQQFFSQEPGWDQLPRVSIHWRPELESVFTMGNKVRTENPALARGRALDPNPQYAAQIFGYKQNQQTGQVRSYSLGYVASDARLNTDPLAINKETQTWTNPPPPIKIHKDMLVPEMDKNGLHITLASIDNRSTYATKKSGNPFGVYNMTDKEWNDSIALRDKLAADGVKSPYSATIAQIRHSQNTKTVSAAISDVADKTVTDVTQAASAPELKANLEKNANLVLTPKEADEIFAAKEDPTMKKSLETVVAAENSGNGRVLMEAKVGVMKTLSTVKRKYSGVEDTGLTPATMQLDLPTNTRVASPGIPSSVTPSEPTGSLPDRIITNAQRELPGLKPQSAPAVAAESPTAIAGNYLAEGKDAIDNAQPHGRRYAAGDEAMVASATKKYADTHAAVISSMENRVQSDLQGRNMPQPLIDEVKNQLRIELQNHSSSILGNKEPSAARDALPTPKLIASEFYKGIDEGIKSVEPAAQYWNKAIDKGLKDMLGPGYRKDSRVAQALDEYFGGHGEFFNFMNKEGKEIQQTPEIARALASGDRKAYFAALDARRQQNVANKAGVGGNMTEQELRDLGVEPGEGDFAGMTVRPEHQEGLVGDLSRGENLMLPIFGGEGPTTGKQSVLAARTLFLGQGKTGEGGLKTFLLSRFPNAKRSVQLDQLERDATAADTTHSIRLKMQSEKLAEAEKLLPGLRKQSEAIKKVIETPGDRAKWEDPKQLAEDYKDIISKIEKYSKMIEETKSDGAGGPGVPPPWTSSSIEHYREMSPRPRVQPDGRGGPGDLWGSLGGMVSSMFGGSPSGPITITDVPQQPKPTSYNVRGVNVTDSDLGEAANVLYGEISNRPADKQKFEIRHILNTAINRATTDPKTWGSTLTQVLQKPYQYQSYAPQGITGPGGRTIESQYQKAKAGDVDPGKMRVIQDTLDELKSDSFPDTTGGATFYVHASDGTLWLGKTPKEAKMYANQHERQRGEKTTQWGTAVGAPVQASPLVLKTLGK